MHVTVTRARSPHRPHRAGVLLAALAVPAVLALSACSGGSSDGGPVGVSGTAGPAGLSSSTPSTSASTTAPAGSAGGSGSSGSSGTGCSSGEQQAPRGVKTVATADLDGDGKADRIWLWNNDSSSSLQRRLGVVYSAGGGASVLFSSADPESAIAVAGRLAGGAAIILLDTGRSVKLYSVVNCAITATTNAQGVQYTFDKGFTGYGTGVGCPTLSGGEQLAGYLARSVGTGGKHYKVTRTTINVTDGGRRASNGGTTTLGTDLSADSSAVKTAFAVACAGSGTAKEAAS